MKKYLPTIILAFIVSAVCAQEKPDTTISKKDINTVQQNMLIIQQNIHVLHIDGILRDKLDSIYQQSAILLSPKPVPKKDGKKP